MSFATLNDASRVDGSLFRQTILSLSFAKQQHFDAALSELFQKCLRAEHKISQDAAILLTSLNLMEEGQVPFPVRKIVMKSLSVNNGKAALIDPRTKEYPDPYGWRLLTGLELPFTLIDGKDVSYD